KNVEVFYLAEEGVFMQAGTRTFILDKLNRSANTFDHVFLFDYRGPSGLETLTASSGVLIPVEGQRRPILRLDNGHRMKLDPWPPGSAEFLRGSPCGWPSGSSRLSRSGVSTRPVLP